jgi:uncharacterized protein DUF6941
VEEFVLPSIKAFVICDKIIQDKNDNKFSAIGVFDNITAEGFPVTHIGFGLLILLTNAYGKYNLKVDLVNAETGDVVLKIDFDEIEITDALLSNNIGFNVPPVTFRKEGRYEFRFFANGHFVERRDLLVLLKGE